MPRNGSGVYTLPAGNPVIKGTVISSTTQNNTMSDVAAELTNSIAADGQKVPTANLPMGGFKHTGVLNANARDQYAAVGQVQDGAFVWCGTAAGTANALTFSPIPAITAYAAGQVFRFQAGAAANTAATTVAISGLAVIDVEMNGAPCIGNEIAANNWYELLLSSATKAQLSHLGNLSANLTTALNDKRSTVALTATTSPIWTAGTGKIIDGTGTPKITDFPAAPQAGAQREVYPAAGAIMTHGGNISVQGNANATAAAGDKWIINAVTTTKFYVAIDPLLIAATQAQQEAASSSAFYVAPSNQQYHPSSAKAWARVTESGGVYTLASSYGISGISKSGTGIVRVDLSVLFSSVNFGAIASPTGPLNIRYCTVTVTGAAAVDVSILRPSTEAYSDGGFSIWFFGDL